MNRRRIPVVFVAPFFAETTLRFLSAAASLEGVALGLVTQEPASKIPRDLGRRLAGYHRVGDAFDADQLANAVVAICGRRPPQRLIGALEQLQVALATVRERLGI